MADDDDDFHNRRTQGPGRRAEDYLYESLVDRLRRIENRLERIVDKFDRTIERLVDYVNKSEGTVHKRVDDLEGYHIEEQANVRTRVAERTRRFETWQRIAIAFSIVSALAAVGAVVVAFIALNQ